MPIQISDNGSTLIAIIDNEHLTETALDEIVPTIIQAVESNPKTVIMDLSRVQFLPSLGIGILVKVHTELNKRKQRLLIAGMQPGVREVMRITRLDKVFDLNDSLESAINKLHAQHASAE